MGQRKTIVASELDDSKPVVVYAGEELSLSGLLQWNQMLKFYRGWIRGNSENSRAFAGLANRASQLAGQGRLSLVAVDQVSTEGAG